MSIASPVSLQYDPKKADVFAWGFILYECLTLEREPVCRRRDLESSVVTAPIRLCDTDLHGERHQPRSLWLKLAAGTELTLDDPILLLLKGCWNTTPAERPTFVEICERFEQVPQALAFQVTQDVDPRSRSRSLFNRTRATEPAPASSADSIWSWFSRSPTITTTMPLMGEPLLEPAPGEMGI